MVATPKGQQNKDRAEGIILPFYLIKDGEKLQWAITLGQRHKGNAKIIGAPGR